MLVENRPKYSFKRDDPRKTAMQVVKAMRELLLSPGKILAAGGGFLRLAGRHWSRHVFIAGGSGNGKSKLLECVCRQLLLQGQGFTFIDPHGDTARALVQFAAVAGIDPARVLYLKPTTDHCFSLDLLDGAPETEGANKALKLAAWIDSTADRVIRSFLRSSSAADQDMMRRLKHRLRTLIWCCAVPVNGKHLGLSDMRALIDPRRPEFGAVVDRIGPALQRLKPEVFWELQEVRGTRNDALRDKWMESTANLLDDTLGVVLQLVFGQHAPTLDLADVIRNMTAVLVDLSENDDLGRGQSNVIGGMLISALINTARKTPEEERVDHYLIIDEAENYIGEDLRMAFSEMRKFRLPVCIAFQDLSCLRKGELDLVERVISICCLWLVFQQQDPENVEYLGKALKLGSLDMTPLLIDSTLPDGYDWVDTQTVSEGESESESSTVADSVSRTRSTTRQTHTSTSIQESVSLALSETRGESESSSWSEGESEQRGEGVTRSTGRTDSAQFTRGNSRSDGVGSSWSASDGRTRTQGQSASLTVSEGESTQRGQGWSFQRGSNWSRQDSEGRSSQTGETRSEQDSEGTSSQKGKSSGTSEGESSGSSESAGSSRVTRSGGDGASTESANAGRSQSSSVTTTQGESESEGQSRSHSTGTSHSQTDGRSESHTEGVGGSVTRGESGSVSRGRNSSVALGVGVSSAEGVSHTDSRGGSVSRTAGTSETEGRGTSRSEGEARQVSSSRGSNRSRGGGAAASRGNGVTTSASLAFGRGRGESLGESDGLSVGRTVGTGSTKGTSRTVTSGKIPLARHRFLKVPNGKTVVAVADQFYDVMDRLAALPERVVFVKVKGMPAPFLMEVHEVLDPYAACGKPQRSREWRDAERETFLRKVYGAACYFEPTDEAHRGRVARFLAESGSAAPAQAVPTALVASEGPEEENPIS